MTVRNLRDAPGCRTQSLLLQTFRREAEAHPTGGSCHRNARIHSDDV